MVNIHAHTTRVEEDEVIVTPFQRCAHFSQTPVIELCLLKIDKGSFTVHSESELASFGGVTIAHVDVVVTLLLQLELMTQRCCSLGAQVDVAHCGEVLHILCPPTAVSQCHTSHVLSVHVFSLNDDFTRVVLRLLWQVGCEWCAIHYICATLSSCTCAIDSHVQCSQMLHIEGEGARFGIPLLCSGVVGKGALAHRVGRFSCGTFHHNLVQHLGGGVVAVVVQIEINVVAILTNDTTAQLTPSQFKALASVVLERYLCRSSFLLIHISIRRVGDQLVLVAVHVKVACAHLGVLCVEVIHFTCLSAPTGGVVRFLHLHRNVLSQIVVQTCHDWHGSIATCGFEVTEVIVPLPIVPLPLFLLIERVCLQIKPIVEVIPSRVVISFVIDDHNLGLLQHFFTSGDIHGTIDDFTPHV